MDTSLTEKVQFDNVATNTIIAKTCMIVHGGRIIIRQKSSVPFI